MGARTKAIVVTGGLAIVVIVLLVLGRGTDGNSVPARTDRIANSFKCPTCQGLSVAQSKATRGATTKPSSAKRMAGASARSSPNVPWARST